MNNTVYLQGTTVNELLTEFRGILRDEFAASIPAPPTAKLYLNIDEASEFTGQSKSKLYRLTSEKKIKHLKRDGKLLFSRTDLVAWLESGRQELISNQG